MTELITTTQALMDLPLKIKKADVGLLSQRQDIEDLRLKAKRLELSVTSDVERDAQTEDMKAQLSNDTKRKAEAARRLEANEEYRATAAAVSQKELDIKIAEIERDYMSRTFWGLVAIVGGRRE